jgi:tripartite ATP-independent transporter DctM subunit
MLIIMADQLSLSVGNLFMGAMIPGLMLGGLYILFVLIAARLINGLAPAPTDLPPVTASLVATTLLHVIPPLLLILAVLGSIFFGIATPTEASGLGAAGATILALLNGKLSLAVLKDVCYKTSITTAFIFGIFLGATAYAVVLRQLGGDEFIAHILQSLPFTPGGIVIAILVMAFIAGFFLDWLEISLIMLPLVAPVVAALGFDLTWFVVLFAVSLQTSFLTPPVGFSLFYVKGVVPSTVTTQMIYKGVVPFVLLQVLAVALVYIWPQLVLWLPQVAYG